MAELVLQLKKINKYFGKNHVIKNVDLEFEKGHFITFLGPSCCRYMWFWGVIIQKNKMRMACPGK